jgi:hypothetical protein
MAGNSRDVDLTIKARDEASRIIAGVGNALDAFGAKTEKTAKASEGIDRSLRDVGKAFGDLNAALTGATGKSTAEVTAAYSRMTGGIDAATAALGRQEKNLAESRAQYSAVQTQIAAAEKALVSLNIAMRQGGGDQAAARVQAATAAYRELQQQSNALVGSIGRQEAQIASSAGGIRQMEGAAAAAQVALGAVEKRGLGIQPYQVQQLSYQINDLFTQVASGTSIFQALGQQGGQIVQIFPGIGGAILRFLVSPLGLATTAVAAFATAAAFGLKRVSDMASASRELAGTLALSADGARYNAQALAQMMDRVDGFGTSFAEVRKAVKELVDLQVDPRNLEKFIESAKNLSRVTGEELPKSAAAIGEAFSRGFDAVAKLDDKLKFLTASERAYIRELFDSGQAQKARAEAFSIYERKAAEAARATRSEWTDVGETMSKTFDLISRKSYEALAALGSFFVGWANKFAEVRAKLAEPFISRDQNGLSKSPLNSIAIGDEYDKRYGDNRGNQQERYSAAADAYKYATEGDGSFAGKTAARWAEEMDRAREAIKLLAIDGKQAGREVSEANRKSFDDLRRKIQEAGEAGQQLSEQQKLQAVERKTLDEAAANRLNDEQAKQLALEAVEKERTKIAKERAEAAERTAAAEVKAYADRATVSETTTKATFTDGQFVDAVKKFMPEVAANLNREQILALRQNLEFTRKLIEASAEENARALRAAGVEVTRALLDVAQRLGAAAAIDQAKTAASGSIATANEAANAFINTVRKAGLTNRYALAAVGATGERESGNWDPKKGAGEWSDPSESGQPGRSGGYLSWRAERLAALRRFARENGDTGNGSAETQGAFFAQENKALIEKLNAAKSVDEAMSLMNEAWKFAGWDRPGGERDARFAAARRWDEKITGGEGARSEQGLTDQQLSVRKQFETDAAKAAADRRKEEEKAAEARKKYEEGFDGWLSKAREDTEIAKAKTAQNWDQVRALTIEKEVRARIVEAEKAGLSGDALKKREQEIREIVTAEYDAKTATEARARAQEAVEKPLNDLMERRRLLMEQITFAQQQGQQGQAEQLKTQLTGVNAELEKAIANAILFWQQTGGAGAENAILKLQGLQAQLQTTANTSVVTGKQINDMLAGGVVSAFDRFWQSMANGEKAVVALRNAFMQFAADFLRQIASMILKQMMLNLLQSAFGGSTGAAGAGGGIGGIIASGINMIVRHGGGMVDGSGPSRTMFANLPRYHGGGIAGLKPNEIATVLEKGEEVLTADDPRHILNGGGAGGQAAPNISVINTIDATDWLNQALGTPAGERILQNHIRANSGAFRAALG